MNTRFDLLGLHMMGWLTSLNVYYAKVVRNVHIVRCVRCCEGFNLLGVRSVVWSGVVVPHTFRRVIARLRLKSPALRCSVWNETPPYLGVGTGPPPDLI